MKQLSNKKLRQYLTWLQANEVKMDKLADKIQKDGPYLSDESKYTALHNKRMKYLAPLLDYADTETTLLIEGPDRMQIDGVCISKSGLEYYLNLVAHPISFLLLEGWFNLRFKNNLEILELVFPKQRTSSVVFPKQRTSSVVFPKQRTSSNDIVVRIDMTWLD